MRPLSSYLLPIIFFCSYKTSLKAQNPNYVVTNYTVEDGLPSNECHDIVQDSLGYIWIATDRGLSRFDGYKFKNYSIKDGLLDLSCLELQVDVEGNIWINTLSKELYKVIVDKDTIVAYKHNNIIQANYENLIRIEEFYVDSKLGVHMEISGGGVMQIDNSGQATFHKSIEKYRTHKPYFIEKGIIVENVSKDEQGEDLPYGNASKIYHPFLGTKYVYFFKHGEDLIFEEFNEDSKSINNIGTPRAWHIDENLWLYTILEIAYLNTKSNIGPPIKFGQIQDLQVNNQSVIVASIISRDIKLFSSVNALKKMEYQVLLEDANFSAISIVNKENYWASSTDKGIFYLKLPKVKQSALSLDEPINGIESDQHNNLYLNVNREEIMKYNVSTFEYEEIKDIVGETYEIEYDPSIKSIILCGANSCYLNTTTAELKSLDYYEQHSDYKLNSKHVVIHSKLGWMFCSAWYRIGFSSLDSNYFYSTHENGPALRIIDAIEYKDGYFIGKVDGLYELREDSIYSLTHLSPLFKSRINYFAKRKNDYLIGTVGNGLVFWDSISDPFAITANDGLLSNNIEHILVDTKDRILCSTYAGVSIIDYHNQDSFTIENYTTFHGLPSNQVFDIAELHGKYYVGTGKGVGIIDSEKEEVPIHKPKFERILLSGMEISIYDSLIEYSAKYNDLEINYITLDYEMQGNIDYRYKLNDADWTITKSTSARYPDLHPGDYTFYLSSENKDGVWSEPLKYEFHICYPWYEQWYFNQSLILISLSLFYLFYKYQLKRAIKENKINEEIRDLEKAALQAQMNPHFIFNCLNSIQSFIMANDKEQAMMYLSKFAKLIRQNLNASVDSKITLSQEVEMLDNYLQLEQLRFNHKFEYRIDVDSKLDTLDTKLSPMLIQPFVENAVLHGMRETNGKGLIKILFNKIPEKLEVIIKDNGKGLNSFKSHKEKSLGMSITQKRLAFLNKQDSDEFELDVQSSYQGTEVRVWVPVR